MSAARPLSNPPSSRSSAPRPARSLTPPMILPKKAEYVSEPCAATASFVLFSQGSQIVVLHHDTLSVERRFSLHLELVLWIVVDNVSERGSGRLAVSFDAGKTAIIWDIQTGHEISRFSAYENMRTACFMRNGNIVFGNDQGNITIYEPGTSEHVSSRTIFDPVTAIAPATDCQTFAIGYANGSILIATIKPSFTILHTLNTSRAPSKIVGLAWHGSSSKSKTDMLATQTLEGDLRVWSVPKTQHTEQPTIIRILQKPDGQDAGLCWFAWSKNGRLVQHTEGETRAWDVRTKRVTYDIIPTVEGVVGITNFGPTATLFTLGRDHSVQQYDINPSTVALQVASRQHLPSSEPPLELRQGSMAPSFTDAESSADESAALSPLEKIAKEMDSLDALQSEIRDTLMPLSPTTREGSISSRGSGRNGRRARNYLYDQPESSRGSVASRYDGTEFSFGTASKLGRESISARSTSSFDSGSQSRRKPRTSTNLRKEVLRSPGEHELDLFPYLKSRLREVPFRPPHYGDGARTPELLRREMLSVVFGWEGDITALIRDEISHQRARSASSVLLSKWLGDIGADSMASLVGSESMTSSDWMLLALSSIGKDSQKKVGEAFVQRLLEKGDVHPAVAILLGLGESHDAIEVYVSQKYPMEALLLTCLVTPSDWQRISHLLRMWGEAAIKNGDAETAVRCLSCTSVETSEPWRSPGAQDLVFAAHDRLMRPPSAGAVASPTFSIPSRTASGRIKNSSLKLITTFGEQLAAVQSNDPLTTKPKTAITPIVTSAMPLSATGGLDPWARNRGSREPSTARTATPGGYTRRKRLPSKADIERAKIEAAEMATPITAARDYASTSRTASRTSNSGRRTPSVSSTQEPTTALRPPAHNAEGGTPMLERLPSPSQGVFAQSRGAAHDRHKSRDLKSPHLNVEVMDTAYIPSPIPGSNTLSLSDALQSGTLSPPLSANSLKTSTRGKGGDVYISSVEEARVAARKDRAESRRRGESRARGESRSGRSVGRARDPSESRGSSNVRFIKPGKRSPASPIPMSPEEIAKASNNQNAVPATSDDEEFYKTNLGSPVESQRSGKTTRSESRTARMKRVSTDRISQPDTLAPPQASRTITRKNSPEALLLKPDDGRGRSGRSEGSHMRSMSSPSSPLPVLTERRFGDDKVSNVSDGSRRLRSQSANRRGGSDDLQTRRTASRDARGRSASRKRGTKEDQLSPTSDYMRRMADDNGSQLSSVVADSWVSSSVPSNVVSDSWVSSNLPARSFVSETTASTLSSSSVPRGMSRKELAAKELEERRRSLARRPSAPQIPFPGEANERGIRPAFGSRSNTDLGDSPTSFLPPMSRSHTADTEGTTRHGQQRSLTGQSTPSAPIGLPATPRAMRHPRYMSADPSEREGAPAVPGIPSKFSDLGSINGSALSMVTGSQLSTASSAPNQHAPSMVTGSLLSTASSAPSQQRYEGGIMLNPSELSSVLSMDQDSELSPSSYVDDVGPLLPATVYGQKSAPPRSASAPAEPGPAVQSLLRPVGVPQSNRLSVLRQQIRKISPPDSKNVYEVVGPVSSIDAALHSADKVSPVIIVPELYQDERPILPELRHLADVPIPPPPPPPPPGLPTSVMPFMPISLGDVSISAIDVNSSSQMLPASTFGLPAPIPRATTASPSQHRRNMPSAGDSSSFGSRIRGIGDRMRSTSKSRTRSSAKETRVSPYESVPPTSFHHANLNQRAQSPYEQAMAAQNNPDYISPASPIDPRLNEMSIPPSSLPDSRTQASAPTYRNPKEIRANMPPNALQGTYVAQGGFL